jgi:hypothetical protein
MQIPLWLVGGKKDSFLTPLMANRSEDQFSLEQSL